jgi:mRNA-degrading endonuclease RelE of RelBE toxin-antitoxin system
MIRRKHFEVIVDERVELHLAAIERKERSVIFDAIEDHLRFEPAEPTRNRKRLRIPNSLGVTWELRCGANNRYRVFYDVDMDNNVVVILAIGRKVGNRLYIGGEEFVL